LVAVGVPAEPVIPFAAVHIVGAVTADQEIVTIFAVEVVVEDVAEEGVVARSPPDRVAAGAAMEDV